MENRLKIILIGLAALLIISLLFSFSTLLSKTRLIKDYTDTKEANEKLKAENKDLVSKITSFIEEKKNIIKKLSAMEGELDAITKEKDALQNKYSLIEKEKESLIEKLQELSLKQITPPPIEKPEAKIKLPLVSEDAYWGDVLRESVELKLKVRDLENQIGAIKLRYAETEKEKQSLRQELENLREQKEELLRGINRDGEVTKNLSIDLAKERNQNQELKTQLDKMQEEKIELEKQVSDLEKKLNIFDENLSSVDSERILSEDGVVESEKSAQELSKQQNEQEQKGKEGVLLNRKNIIELSPIIVRPPQEPKEEFVTKAPAVEEASEEVSGKILNVNKENNFVIINLGKGNGIKLDQKFSVFRNDKKIADIIVVKIRDTISACDIKNSTKDVKVGDIVR